MGNLKKGHQTVDAILNAIPAMANALAEAERWLLCRDQVKQLADAVESVLAQAQLVLAQAYLEYRIRSENALMQESVDLAVDAITMLIGDRTLSRSRRASKTTRLGKVLIAVGPEGIPEDLSVVNVSELAESEGKTVREIERVFADQEHVLFTVEEFKPLASWLKEEVLCGRAALPYHPAGPSLTSAAGAIRLRIRR